MMIFFFFISSLHQQWKQFSNYSRPPLQRETLLVFICAGECHVEKWKTKAHSESTHWKLNKNSWWCHTVLYECFMFWSKDYVDSGLLCTSIFDYFSFLLSLVRFVKYIGATNDLVIRQDFYYLHCYSLVKEKNKWSQKQRKQMKTVV